VEQLQAYVDHSEEIFRMPHVEDNPDTAKNEQADQKRPYDPPCLIQIDEKHEAPYATDGPGYDGLAGS